MSVKNVLLIVLVMVNLLLLSAVILQIDSPRPAQAQVIGGGNAYAVVTAKITGSEDTLWVLNLRTRMLSVLRMPQPGNVGMTCFATRDLQRDLRGMAGGGP